MKNTTKSEAENKLKVGDIIAIKYMNDGEPEALTSATVQGFDRYGFPIVLLGTRKILPQKD